MHNLLDRSWPSLTTRFALSSLIKETLYQFFLESPISQELTMVKYILTLGKAMSNLYIVMSTLISFV